MSKLLLIEGTMLKKITKVGDNWSKLKKKLEYRHLILYSDHIMYYKDKEKAQKDYKGKKIRIKGSEVVVYCTTSEYDPFTFSIQPKHTKDVYMLVARDAKQRDAWIENLARAGAARIENREALLNALRPSVKPQVEEKSTVSSTLPSSSSSSSSSSNPAAAKPKQNEKQQMLEDSVHEGDLLLGNKSLKKWTTRYCVLTTHSLVVFKQKKKGEKPAHELELHNSTVGTEPAAAKFGQKYAFCLITKNKGSPKKYVFAALDELDLHSWMGPLTFIAKADSKTAKQTVRSEISSGDQNASTPLSTERSLEGDENEEGGKTKKGTDAIEISELSKFEASVSRTEHDDEESLLKDEKGEDEEKKERKDGDKENEEDDEEEDRKGGKRKKKKEDRDEGGDTSKEVVEDTSGDVQFRSKEHDDLSSLTIPSVSDAFPELKAFSPFNERDRDVDTTNGFQGEYQLEKSDNLAPLWEYLKVPLPLRMALLESSMKNIDSVKIIINSQNNTVEVVSATVLSKETTGALFSHRWQDVITFRGTIIQKKLYWDCNEEEMLTLLCLGRLESELGHSTTLHEEYVLSFDGSLLLQRLIILEKQIPKFAVKRIYRRISPPLQQQSQPQSTDPSTPQSLQQTVPPLQQQSQLQSTDPSTPQSLQQTVPPLQQQSQLQSTDPSTPQSRQQTVPPLQQQSQLQSTDPSTPQSRQQTVPPLQQQSQPQSLQQTVPTPNV